MENNPQQITIPEDIAENLHLSPDEAFQLRVDGQKLVIEPVKNETENQTISLRWFLIPTILSSIFFLGYFLLNEQRQIMMTGSISIASMVIIIGLLSGMCSFLIFFIQQKRQKKNNLKDIYWRNLPTIMIALSVILGLLLAGFFWLIGLIFEGASFDLLTATLIFSLFISLINYIMIYFALTISPRLLTTLLIVTIVGGAVLSMATNSQLQWWQRNFSFLGTEEANKSWQFNLTLAISALLMITLIDYLFVELHRKFPKSARLIILRILLTAFAISLGAVGYFPNNGTGQLHTYHNRAANSLVYIIILLIVGLKWLLPKVSREFLLTSYSIGIILFIANFLFSSFHYLSLTAFELIAFILAFSWILLLVQYLQKITKDSDPVYPISLQITNHNKEEKVK